MLELGIGPSNWGLCLEILISPNGGYLILMFMMEAFAWESDVRKDNSSYTQL